MRNSSQATNRAVRIVLILVVIIIGFFILFALANQHMYFFKKVDTDQIGVQKQGGQIVNIVPPGLYSDVALFAELLTYSTQAYQFSVSDAELITSDNQRIGVTVSGSFFRPDYSKADLIPVLWTKYSHIYMFDEALQLVSSSRIGSANAAILVG